MTEEVREARIESTPGGQIEVDGLQTRPGSHYRRKKGFHDDFHQNPRQPLAG